MLILSLFVLQVLPAAFCYDIEVQGKLKIANQYLTALRQPSNLVNLLLSYLPEKFVGRGNLPRALESIAIPYLRTTNNTRNSTQKTLTQVGNKITDSPKKTHTSSSKLESFMIHLQNKGKMTIHDISEKILADLDIKKNITHILKVVTSDYINMFQNYYDYIKMNQYDADRDLLYLDMVETSCRLLFEEEKKLLNDIIMQEGHSHHGKFKKITEELLKHSYLYKKETMRYLCDTYEVCKEYPAISDYGAKIISEILMLDDLRLNTILKILSKIYKQNEKIIARVTEKEDRQLILTKLHDFRRDLFATKEFLALVRAVITQRFKPVTSGSEEFIMKTKATRILLDIFEKALNIEDDVITIDSDNALQAIKSWAAHKRDDIEEILEEFAKNLIIRLEHNLTRNARKEIKSLITAIMREKTKESENLLNYGSKYLKGKDFHPDVDVMLF